MATTVPTIFVPKDHLSQAQHNEEFARGLISLKIPFYDWAITATYYAAVHYIYFKLAPPSILTSHIVLEQEIIKKYPANSKVWNIYKKLQNKSEIARYYPHLAIHMSNDKGYVNSILKLLDAFKIALGV